MQRILLLMTVALMLALMMVALAVPAFATTSSVKVPIDERIDTDRCTDELVQLSGSFLIVHGDTEDANGGLHIHFLVQTQGVSGEGLTSGRRYRAVGVFEENVYFAPEQERAGTFVGRFHIISNGSSANLLADTTFHFTFDANGKLTAEVMSMDTRCVG